MAGSSIGLLYWSSTSESDLFPKMLLSFADWPASTVIDESSGDDHRSYSSVLRKLSLPDHSSKFLFGGDNFF